MKHIIAVNASPRKTWNTASLVRAAAEGARETGAEVELIHLYALEKFTGCVSCFGCKREGSMGRCICRDGLHELLEKIRQADGLILGTPNYLGETSALFRALYERLVFPYITYNLQQPNANERPIPVLFILTSNAPDEAYQPGGGSEAMVERYRGTLSRFIGPTEVLIAGGTKQVSDYSRYNWTLFDPQAREEHHARVFPQKLEQARIAGRNMVS